MSVLKCSVLNKSLNSIVSFFLCRPKFLILASDGLWDTFSNEEAVAFIKEHLDEPHFGAKSITLQSYYRGSVDNITVIVIVFKNGQYQIGTSSKSNNNKIVVRSNSGVVGGGVSNKISGAGVARSSSSAASK